MTSNPPPQPSSAVQGFFQTLPTVPPQYTRRGQGASGAKLSEEPEDVALVHAISLYLPQSLPSKINDALHSFARLCLRRETLRLGVDAELNTPRLYALGTFGQENRRDALWTGEGWRGMKRIGIKGGIVALGHVRSKDEERHEWNRRVHQFATVHLFVGSSALVTCPAAMTDGGAILLTAHLNDADGDQPGRAKVLAEYRERLVSFDADYAFTSGQWMTERTGGSDVSLTESLATRLTSQQIEDDGLGFGSNKDAIGHELGPWRIDGFKWFSSATDADTVILLARTSKGISTFAAPMRRTSGDNDTVMNGVRIVRLKDKMGTKQLPTAELEIKGMRAWLIGEEGKGIKAISTILNSTRLWTAVGAVGGLARGLAIARAYSRVRKVQNALLQDNAQHVAWMAKETVKYWAACHLAVFGSALQGISEQGSEAVENTKAQAILPTSRTEAEILLRVLTPVLKAQCSLAAVQGLRACMESLGGVGYCENNHDGGVMNIARILRDTNVNCIWEGTTSVMGEDFVRAVKGRQGQETINVLDRLVTRILNACKGAFAEGSTITRTAWSQLVADLTTGDKHELHYRGHEILRRVEIIMCSSLLMYNAISSGESTITHHIASRWIESTMLPAENIRNPKWKEQAKIDREIFMGGGGGSGTDARPISSKI